MKMGISKKELLSRMDSHEIQEYVEFCKIEPLEYQADMRMAILASTIANLLYRGKKQKSFKPEDFMLMPEKLIEKTKNKKASDKDILASVNMMNTVFGGKDLRK
jgi:hypothetical protein